MARLSVALRDLTRTMRGPDSREEGSIWNSTWSNTQRANTARVLPVALSYVASSLAEPRPKIREGLTVYVASLSRTLRSSARPRSINRVASFLTQGNENILRARICTAVRTGAKRGTHFVGVLCTYFI